MTGLHICATGRALPRRAMSNEDMCAIVETSDEWITSRTGIQNRYFCEGEENTSTLATAAAQIALERAGIPLEELACCIVATVSPDYATPSVGCLLQRNLNLPQNIPCFDISVGCTGFVYALQVAKGLLLQDKRPYALVVGAEALSRITDMTDRSTCVLFGDGGGAAVVKLSDAPYSSVLGAKGDTNALWVGGGNHPSQYIHMDGTAVFRFAVEAIPKCVGELLEDSNLTLEEIDWIVPHQANVRIVESAAKRLKCPMDKFYLNLKHYGNTSAASIPIALDEMAEQGLLQRGQKIICVGFGAGLTWGGILLEW